MFCLWIFAVKLGINSYMKYIADTYIGVYQYNAVALNGIFSHLATGLTSPSLVQLMNRG